MSTAGDTKNCRSSITPPRTRSAGFRSQKAARRSQADALEGFVAELQTVDTSLPLEFSERLWHNLIDKVTVHADGRVVFRFRNGAEIGEKM